MIVMNEKYSLIHYPLELSKHAGKVDVAGAIFPLLGNRKLKLRIH